jgi:hypothetical protein
MLAAVIPAALRSSLMMLVSGRQHHVVRGRFSLSDRHRSIALEGQHRDREPQEKAEEEAHGPGMVPQIKSMHQGTAFGTLRSLGPSGLGLVRMPTAVGLYRHSGIVHY